MYRIGKVNIFVETDKVKRKIKRKKKFSNLS